MDQLLDISDEGVDPFILVGEAPARAYAVPFGFNVQSICFFVLNIAERKPQGFS